jgi:hypothetical protein
MAKIQIRLASLAPSAAAAGLVLIVTAALTGCGPMHAGAAHPAAVTRPAAAGHPTAGRHHGAASHQSTGRSSRFACADQGTVSAVRVARIPALSQLGQSKPLPRVVPRITVRDPAKARALARAVCGLPAMPHGVLSCPIDVGGGYQLVFTAAGRTLHPVTVEATGCQTVTGAGPAPAGTARTRTGRSGPAPIRWVARTPGFWTAFARLTGIRAPAHSP